MRVHVCVCTCVSVCLCVYISMCGANQNFWVFTESLGFRSQRAESTLNILTLPYVLQLSLATCLLSVLNHSVSEACRVGNEP